MQSPPAHSTAHRQHGPVAFVGDGHSDRLGALYADVVFAKRHLAAYCSRERVPFLEWDTFDDVRRALETSNDLPGAVEPARCPRLVRVGSTEERAQREGSWSIRDEGPSIDPTCWLRPRGSRRSWIPGR